MQDCKVNILGTEYDITMNCDDEDRDGDTNFYSKTIRIRPLENLLDKEATDTERKIREKHVSRHELYHSFLWEAGETELAYNEHLVDWLAAMTPKIFKVFQELDIL